MFVVSWNRIQPTSPIIKTDWQWLIRLAWGRRRVSSRAPDGTEAYPRDMAASLGLWVRWISEISREPQIVIGAHRAIARIQAQLAPHREQIEAIDDEDVARLLSERLRLRAERKFSEADEIRDYLVSRGVVVSDAKA